MSDERLLAILREPEPQPLGPPPVGLVVTLEHGQWGHLCDDVFPEFIPAHAVNKTRRQFNCPYEYKNKLTRTRCKCQNANNRAR